MHDSTLSFARRVRVSALPRIATCLLILALAALPAAAAELRSKQELTAGNPNLAKVSSHLLRARLLAAEKRPATEIAAAVPSVIIQNGLVEVDVSLFRLNPEILAALRNRGLLVDSHSFKYAHAYGRIDPARLADVAAHSEVSTIRSMPRRATRVGDVENQADVTMRSVDVRGDPDLLYDGTGVTIGIISDSFNKTTLGGTVSVGACACATPGSTCTTVVTGMTNQGTGDLPPSIPILDDCTVGTPNCDFLSDEGAAIGELMFDIAPAANFMFHSAFNSSSDFATGITELVNCGADVIVDDVFYTRQPFFQDGNIAQAAQGAVDAGVPYFSAAGNDATFGINDHFVDSNPSSDNTLPIPNGNDFHDFGGGDTFAGITLPDDCEINAELQWSEPFAGPLGPGASSDLDLFLLDSEADPASAGNILASSTNLQGCGIPLPNGGDPLETIQYLNTTGGDQTVFLAVEHHCGDKTVELRIVNLSFNCSTLGWIFEDGSGGGTPIFVDAQIFGHPAARDVVAVGAAFFAEVGGIPGIAAPGELDPPPGQLDVEPFSSRGGDLPFYFDGSGAPLPGAPQIRFKPEVTGPDGTNTTFFGADIHDFFEPPGDIFPNFFGTSAAAPNSAAVAALILDATDVKIHPLALKQLLSQGALDMETPGPDDLSGSGFTDALRPIRSLDPDALPLIDELEFDLDGGDFFSSPPVGGLQRVQANDRMIFGDGDFSGVEGLADELIFADGFESGDTSAWSN